MKIASAPNDGPALQKLNAIASSWEAYREVVSSGLKRLSARQIAQGHLLETVLAMLAQMQPPEYRQTFIAELYKLGEVYRATDEAKIAASGEAQDRLDAAELARATFDEFTAILDAVVAELPPGSGGGPPQG